VLTVLSPVVLGYCSTLWMVFAHAITGHRVLFDLYYVTFIALLLFFCDMKFIDMQCAL
jgi:hypothetical protein